MHMRANDYHFMLAVPTHVEVVRVSATEIYVSWIATDADTYVIRYHLVKGSCQKYNMEEEDAVVVEETKLTDYNITGLSPGISYAVSVAAGNEAGRGSFGTELIAECESKKFLLL